MGKIVGGVIMGEFSYDLGAGLSIGSKTHIKTISSLPEHDMVRAFFLDGLGHASRFLLFAGIASFGVAGDFFKSLFAGDAA